MVGIVSFQCILSGTYLNLQKALFRRGLYYHCHEPNSYAFVQYAGYSNFVVFGFVLSGFRGSHLHAHGNIKLQSGKDPFHLNGSSVTVTAI